MLNAAMDPDLKELSIPRKSNKFTKGEHPLRSFFLSRQVSQGHLAKVIGICDPHFSEMIRGIRFLPKDVEEKLYQLKNKILDWEKREGRPFNSP